MSNRPVIGDEIGFSHFTGCGLMFLCIALAIAVVRLAFFGWPGNAN